jgi:pimeloyl-ACP methyl ester carboxylesterase
MHGWSGTGHYFNDTIEHLDLTNLRAVTMDLRGHGDSDKPDHGYSDKQLAADLLAVADTAGAEAFVLIGFSMSGRFAQYVPLIAPDRVRGLALVAPCPASPIPLPPETRRDWVARAGQLKRLAEVTAMFITQPVRTDVLDRFGHEAAKASSFALDATLGLCVEASFADRLQEIRVPAPVVGGIHDSLLTPEVLRQAVAAPLPKGRSVFLNSNHEIPLEQPCELAAVIGAFAAGLAGQTLAKSQLKIS